MSHTSWIEIEVRYEPLVARRITHQKHIFDVRIIEHRVKGLGALAVVDPHSRAVLPNEIIFLNPVQEIRIRLKKPRQGLVWRAGPGLTEAHGRHCRDE